jgi:hypothetical protein
LLMAVEQREAGIVSRKVHFDFLISADHDDVLQHTRGRYPCELVSSKLCR